MTTLAILLLTLLFSMSFGLLQTKGKISLQGMQTGFYLLIIFCVGISLVPEISLSSKNIFWIICGCSLIIILIFRKTIAFSFKSETIYILLFLIFIGCFFINNLNLLRFHSSPDNHGFAATIGSFIHNYSYHDLRTEFMRYTGLNEAIHIGQKTPLLNSVWNIADTRLRYASDMVFTVGRLGAPLWGACIIPLFDPIDSFPSFMIAMGLLTALMFSSNIKEIILSISPIQNKALPPFFFTILLFSPFISIYILEGTLTQFLMLTAAGYYICEIINYLKEGANNDNSILKILICNIFVSITYPNGIILMALISALSIPFFFRKDRNIKKIFNLILMLIINLTLGYFLLGSALLHQIKVFLSGISGIPYNLSLISIFDFLSWGTNALEFSPSKNSTTGYINNNVALFKYKYLTAFLNSIPLLIYTCISLFTFKKIGFKLIALWPILSLFTALSIIPTLNMGSFHPYIYARNLSNFILIGFPIFCCAIVTAYSMAGRKIKIFVLALLSAISINSIYSFFEKTSKFKENSEPFTIIRDMNEYKKLDFANSIIVSDFPLHSISALSLYGPVFYLTDNWNPRFYSYQFPGRRNLIYATKKGGEYNFESMGNVLINNYMDGPINASEIKKLDIYSQ